MKIIPIILFAAFATAAAPGYSSGKPEICIVSGEPLDGDAGKPVQVVYNGQTYTLCCKTCARKFNANPQKYLRPTNATAGR